MRKIILVLSIFFTFLFSSCGMMDSAYIETVQGIVTPQEILGTNNLKDLTIELLERSSGTVDEKNVKWEIEGKTKEGKVVVAKYAGNKVVIPTKKDGDYIQVLPAEIYIITSEGQRINLLSIMMDDFTKNLDFGF